MKKNEDIIKHALEVIRTEKEGLAGLEKFIDEHFADVVNLIANSEGRLIISGIGKSAIVGQKMAATLNSTGTPSVFMHAADATHGDLGIIQEQDVVLIISKSGNTPEIKWLSYLIKELGNTLIGMTADRQSHLARMADYLLYTPVKKEAWYNLAPTTSTIVQMAMGDALAIALLKEKNFTRTDFAKYHPGGSLGKQLLLRVNHFLDNKTKPFVRPESSIKEVIVHITESRVGATAVLDENERVVGIITDGDVRRMLQKYDDLSGLKAMDIMSRHPKTIDLTALAVEALKKMKSHNISQLIILDEDGKYRGIVHMHEILKEGIVL